jgi:hypothetical protein
MTGGFRSGRRRVYNCRRFHSGGVCTEPTAALEDELLELVEPLGASLVGRLACSRTDVSGAGGSRIG